MFIFSVQECDKSAEPMLFIDPWKAFEHAMGGIENWRETCAEDRDAPIIVRVKKYQIILSCEGQDIMEIIRHPTMD